MVLIDILFPVYLMPLTYICPERLRHRAVRGMIVSAPIRTREREGIIVDYNQGNDERPYSLREITQVHNDKPPMSEAHLKLLQWTGQYYHAEPGLVLRSMLPDIQSLIKTDAPTKAARQTAPATVMVRGASRTGNLTARAIRGESGTKADANLTALPAIEIAPETLTPLRSALEKKAFSVLLLHAPSYVYGIRYMLEALRLTDSAIILSPEIDELTAISGHLSDTSTTGEICLLHSGLPKVKRNNSYRAIVEGAVRFVAGTMSAVLAPLERPSLIVVSEEHSPHYKSDKSPRYHARDVAVMRGLLEDTTVLLISATPSVSSYYNALTGRYQLIRCPIEVPRPSIKLTKTRRPLSYRALRQLRRGTHLVYVNKKGYGIPICSDCGFFQTCPKCSHPPATTHPLVLYNEETNADVRTLLCNRCGYKTNPPEACPVCNGYNFTSTGSGTQRIEEILRQRLNTSAVRIDSDIIKKGRQRTSKALSRTIDANIVVATKMLLKPLHLYKHFKGIVIVGADMYLAMPQYQAMERFFQDVFRLSEMAREVILIQTALPDNPVYTLLQGYNYEGLVLDELRVRRELSYPPFSRMALVSIMCREGSTAKAVDILRAVAESFGCVAFTPTIKGFDIGIQVSLRAKGRVELNHEIQRLQKKLHALGLKDVRLDIDIDPVVPF
ncbi:MAG: primosomal protein N' [Nitrospirae bacterium]|nr:primosomal protein N' [Nitrospirota bacterium]